MTDSSKVGLAVPRGSMTAQQRATLVRVVERVAKQMNARQSTFVFEVHGEDILQDAAQAERRGYSLEQYFEALQPKLANWKCDYSIAICSEILESASFNREDPKRHCGVITVNDYQSHVPTGLDIDAYLMYLLLCVALCLRYPALSEHTERAFCLFDLCVARDDFRQCLRKPSLEHCVDNLQVAGASNAEIEAYRKILAHIGQRDAYSVVASVIGGQATSFLFGVALAIIASTIATEWPRTGLVVTACLAVVIAVLTVLRLIRDRSWAEARRRVIWRVAVAVLLAAEAATIFVIGVLDRPSLPSDSRNAPLIQPENSSPDDGS